MHQNRIFLIFLLFIAKGICNEYCDLYKDHVLCVNPPHSPSCPDSFMELIPNQEQQNAIVDWHNRVRQNVSLGEESRGSGGPQPSASNMMKMQWDPELAKIAQSTANQCKNEHDCHKCRRVQGGRFAIGQNWALQFYFNQTNFDFVKGIEGWVDTEVIIFSPKWVDSFVLGHWGHYSQVVWWNARSVGCGAASYRSIQHPPMYDFLIFCNYGASGNLPEAKVYKRGEVCSECPDETECDQQYDGLCSITRGNFKVTDKFPTDQMYLGIAENRHIEI